MLNIHNNFEYLLILFLHLMRSLLMVSGIYCEIGGLSIYHKILQIKCINTPAMSYFVQPLLK